MTEMMTDNTLQPCCRSHKSHMVIKIIGLLLLAGIVGLAILRDRFVANPMWQVSVVGRGEVAYQPDTAKINIGVKVDRAATADAALKQLNDSMVKVVAAITAVGIDKKDIQTQNYNLSPQYDYIYPPVEPGVATPPVGRNVLTGYNANQSLMVTIKDLSEANGLVGKVIVGAGQAGTNEINGISFESSNINTLKDEARLKAIADAKSKAGTLAGAAGVKLGKVIGWWENFVQSPDSYNSYYAMGKGGAMDAGVVTPPTLPSGEYKLIMEMNLNYEVK